MLIPIHGEIMGTNTKKRESFKYSRQRMERKQSVNSGVTLTDYLTDYISSLNLPEINKTQKQENSNYDFYHNFVPTSNGQEFIIVKASPPVQSGHPFMRESRNKKGGKLKSRYVTAERLWPFNQMKVGEACYIETTRSRLTSFAKRVTPGNNRFGLRVRIDRENNTVGVFKVE